MPALINNARSRGDVYGATALQLRIAFNAALVRDDPRGAMEDIQAAETSWSQQEFLLQHYWSLMARLDILAYEGNGPAALALISRQWPQLAAAQLLRVQFSVVESHYRRGRSALMCAFDLPAGSSQRRDVLKQVRQDARTLTREGAEWSAGLGGLLFAGAAHADERTDEARECLRRAEQRFAAAGMALHVAACRRARGRLVGGDEGQGMIAESDDWYRTQRVLNPAAFDRMIAGWND
ncbi:MAG TPA: hypothetical protein VIK52_03775 [Opitutaceae bacterium]